MTSASRRQPVGQESGDSFLEPETAVAERIDQLVLTLPHQQHLRQLRQSQAAWLKQALALHWSAHFPQPFIGFDLEDGLFVAEWQSETRCNTLTINPENHKAWYDPWPAKYDAVLPEEIDLDTTEGWECLRIALTTTQH